MDWQDEQFEKYLREFQPRQPCALALRTKESAPEVWRRLAAAAVVAIVLGTSLRFAMQQFEKRSLEIMTSRTPEQEGVHASLSRLPLTQLAIEDPARLEAQLAAASRRVLPDFRGEKSTLRVLAKE
jgi:hypothetical protein